jgi:predicted SAM-dependent methyltransferase
MENHVGGRVRLNIGSGIHRWPGFVNCDAYGDADVITDCKKLPFETDYADEIHAIHFVEHIPRLEIDNMFVNWHRVLKRGGKLCIEVPCLNKMAQMILDGEKNIRMTLLGIFGDPRDPKPGMMHAWSYTQEELSEILRQAGFENIQVMEPKFHFPRRDMRIEATKP